jgi:paraquat-inducible protein B
MSKKANPTLIGIFTLVGLLLTAAALVLFGAGKIFQKSNKIILYFNQSATGLLVGSEVRFGGVRIGRVTSIKVLIDPNANRKIIPVVVELSEKDLRAVGSTSGASIDFATDTGVKQAVAAGLRAKMKQQSLLTGQLYIEFDIVRGTPGFTFSPEVKALYPTVPTMVTEMDELIAGVADGLKKFNALDIDGTLNGLRDLLVTAKTQIAALNFKAINDNLVGITSDVHTLTSNQKLAKAIDSLDETLTSIDSLTKKANEGFDPFIKDLETVIQQAMAVLTKIDQATADIAKATNPRAPALVRLQNVLEEVERASRAFKELANDLKRNPDALLRGKTPNP